MNPERKAALFVVRRTRMWGYWEPPWSSGGAKAWAWTPFHEHPHNLEFERAMALRKASS